jgi:hypothetical protein
MADGVVGGWLVVSVVAAGWLSVRRPRLALRCYFLILLLPLRTRIY